MMEPLFTSGTIFGFKIGSIIAALLGGLLRVIIRRKDGVANNIIGFTVGVTVSVVGTDASVELIAHFTGAAATEGMHTGAAAALALVGNDLCIALMRYVREKKVS